MDVLYNEGFNQCENTLMGSDDNIFTLFSGKIDTCVDASNELIKMIGD